jgi:hypothetical protein
MEFNVLYIEDDNSGSIVSELKKDNQFNVEVWNPDSLENLNTKIQGKDLVIADFRLDKSGSIADGPSFATALRTKKSRAHKDIPIVLLSVENNITDYYKDFASQGLFDFSIPKEVYLINSTKYNTRLISVIEAYKEIQSKKFDFNLVLGISKEFANQYLDYRIQFSLEKETYSQDVHAYSHFILQNLIRSVGPLIGEDYLSAKLGISKDSPDWGNLKDKLAAFKYTGVYSSSYNRWWFQGIADWFQSKEKNKMSLRRLNAEERAVSLKEILDLKELIPLAKIKKGAYHAKSSSFWSICKETKLPIDIVDGFELYEKELFPWQESQYISYMGISSKKYSKSVKPIDKQRINDIETKFRQ